jgi:hypothetical protein
MFLRKVGVDPQDYTLSQDKIAKHTPFVFDPDNGDNKTIWWHDTEGHSTDSNHSEDLKTTGSEIGVTEVKTSIHVEPQSRRTIISVETSQLTGSEARILQLF